ncbi:MAG TPA: META domain-containing protein [Acidimicrobiia bacterium]|nr:META domain-containing protein [Acidimicrobiia bacterium]
MRKTLVLAAVLGLILAACADGDEASSDPTGTAWVLESGTLDGAAVPIVDGSPITLTFEEDAIAGTAACNSYFGSYTISGSEISFSGIGSTMMACSPDEVMESESKYLQALALVDAFTATEDSLTLTGNGVELVFAVDGA